MKRKLCSIFLAGITAFCTVVTPVGAADKVANTKLNLPTASANAMVNGTFVTESEDMIYRNTMLLVDEEQCSGGQSLRSVGEGIWRSTADPSAPPDAYIDFISDTSEPVYVWMRVKTNSTNAKSMFYNVGKATETPTSYTARHYDVGEIANNYYWQFLTVFDNFVEGETMRFNFQYRHLNFCMDKIVFTTDMDYQPVGINDMPGDTKPDYSSLYPEPPIKPLEEHPRVLFTKEDIPQILQNIESESMRAIYEATVEKADAEINAKLDKTAKRNYNYAMLENITNRALLYALGLRDAAYGRVAVDNVIDYLSTVRFDLTLGDETRKIGATMMMAGVVYDWCYDLITEEEQTYIIKMMKTLAKKTEVGYPPTEKYSLTGHGGEGEIFCYPLLCGIAVYDEDPEMYNLAAGRMFAEMTEVRKMWNQSGAHSVGNAYGGGTRLMYESVASLLYDRMGQGGIMGSNEDLTDLAQTFIYYRLPDGRQIKVGDDYSWAGWEPYTWFRTYDSTFALIAGITKDPYVSQASALNKFISGYATNYLSAIPDLLLADGSVEGKMQDSLPLANKTGYPLTSIQARTNWKLGQDSNAAVVDFEARETSDGPDHNHADTGSFQIYYKGYLALDSGLYQGKNGNWGSAHYWNYYARTIANNCMTIFDPNETTFGGYSNDGGQAMFYGLETYEQYKEAPDRAVTEASYIGPNTDTPEFSFVKTNLTNAYGGDKVKNHERSMVFMDLDNDDYPAAVVIFDDVTSSDKTFKKTWNMHTVEEPQISGATTIVTRTDNGNDGKLVNKTMLPANATIETVGGEGKEYYVNGVNYPNEPSNDTVDPEGGKWRLEISPSAENTRDLFLNSMYVTDASGNLAELPMYQEETNTLVGVTVMDRCVYFSKGSQIASRQTFTLRDNGYDTVKCLVTDIASGLWKVTDANGNYKAYMVNDEENTLYFRAAPGNCTIEKMTGGTAEEITYEKMQKPTYGDFLVYNENRKQFYALDNPTVMNGETTMVPLEQLWKQSGGTLSRNGNIIYGSLNGNEYTFTLGANNAAINGQTYLMSAPLQTIDGTLYINPNDIAYCLAEYDSVSRVLSLKFADYASYDAAGFANYIIPISIFSGQKRATGVANLCDGDLTTAWNNGGIGAEAVLELDAVHNIGEIDIAYDTAEGEQIFANIAVSCDGVNFTEVSSGLLSVAEGDAVSRIRLGASTAKYIKLTFNGNLDNTNNAINEVIVRGCE